MQSTSRLMMTGAVAVAIISMATAAYGQSYPNRPIRMVFPYQAGSGPEVLGRKVAGEASKILGQPIVYENRTGGKGRLGIQGMRSAPADGYFLNFLDNGVAILQPAQDPDFSFEPGKDYSPISILFESPLVLLARPGLPFTDIKALIAYAKANPGKLNWATAAGASGEFLTSRLIRTFSIDVTMIPMRGGAENATATLGGHTDVFFSTTGMKQNVESGKLLALATSGAERWKPFSSAPTFREVGIPFTFTTSYLLLAAVGTPRDIVVKLNRSFHEASRVPELAAYMDELGYASSTGMTPEAVGAFIQAEMKAWTPILRKLPAK